jgi:GNAT superfamily N-acetyltransferase
MPSAHEYAGLTVRPMAAADATAVAGMARELAAALDDPDPALDPNDLVRDGVGPERWFDCFVAEVGGRPIGYAMVCRGYEAHIGKRRLWLSDLYVRTDARRTGAGRALMLAIARLAMAQGCEAIYWDLCASIAWEKRLTRIWERSRSAILAPGASAAGSSRQQATNDINSVNA